MDFDELLKKTKQELTLIAKNMKLTGFSRFSKNELATLISEAEKKQKLVPVVEDENKAQAESLSIPSPETPDSSIVKQEATETAAPIPEVKGEVGITEMQAPQPEPLTVIEPVPDKPLILEIEPPELPPMPIGVPLSGGGAFMYSDRARKVIQKPPESLVNRMPGDLPGDTEIPPSYNRDYLFLFARDPHWLYAYWEISWERAAALRNKELFIRLLRYEQTEKVLEQLIRLKPGSSDWYMHVTGDGQIYEAELGFFNGEQFIVLAASRPVDAPRSRRVPAHVIEFVTIPVKLELKDVVEVIRPYLEDPQILIEKMTGRFTGKVTEKLKEVEGVSVSEPFVGMSQQQIDNTIRAKLEQYVSTLVEKEAPVSSSDMSQKQIHRA